MTAFLKSVKMRVEVCVEFAGNTRKRTIKSPPRSRPVGQTWVWWCWGPNGKSPPRMVALGSFATESEAQQQGLTAYPGTFRVYMLNTISMTLAKQQLKAQDIKEGKTIDEAMRRASSQL